MSSNKTQDMENSQDKLKMSLLKGPARTSIPLLIIALAGLLISLLSGFQESIPFIEPLCTSACRDTVQIHFLHVPFWLWGVVFYSAAALLALFRQRTVTWIACSAAGVEAVLILLMIQLKAPCIFCITNAAVILALIAAAFRKELFWQQMTVGLLFFVAFFFWVPFENNLPYFASANAAGHARYDLGAAATVGGDVITNQRLDVLLGSKLQQMRADIYRLKMERLDQLIIDTILDKEAKKQGKTVDALVNQITSSTSVTDSEVDKYMQEHQQQLKPYEKSMPDLKQRLKAALEEQKRAQVVRTYAHALEPKYDVRVFVPVPRPPKVKVDISGAPSLGPPNAPVTVVEFSDFQCPACRANYEVVKQIMAAYGKKVRWVYKEYPLKRHKYAFEAAEAAHCAADQGKFWQYQAQLYTAPDLSPPNLINIAVQLGMSREKFSKCLQDSKYKALVQKNIREAVQLGVDRTPTYIINGTVFIGGPSLDTFKRLIDEALRQAGAEPQIAGKAK